MSREGQFLVYCIEIYKNAINLTGKETINYFLENGVCNYIISYFEAMHTTGEKYIVNDIDLFIKARAEAN